MGPDELDYSDERGAALYEVVLALLEPVPTNDEIKRVFAQKYVWRLGEWLLSPHGPKDFGWGHAHANAYAVAAFEGPPIRGEFREGSLEEARKLAAHINTPEIEAQIRAAYALLY